MKVSFEIHEEDMWLIYKFSGDETSNLNDFVCKAIQKELASIFELTYQEQSKIRSKIDIIYLLRRKSLSFKEIAKETGFSTATVSSHLKCLEKQGIIKKIYKNRKILNVLQIKNLYFTNFFAEETLLSLEKKGRTNNKIGGLE